MKKLFFLFILLAGADVIFAQTVDNFEVGPYEVDYKGEGDFKYRLLKDVDLYEFFGLKRDTVIMSAEKHELVKSAGQVDIFFSVPRFITSGGSNTFGVDGMWKRRVFKSLYFNVGLSFAVSYGEYDSERIFRKETMYEAGIPLALEVVKLEKKKSSMFFAVGITPAYYGTLSSDVTVDNEKRDVDGRSGCLLVPRIDIGGYIPVNNHHIRIGIFGKYNINCSAEDIDIFKERIGSTFFGASLGLVF